MAEFCNVCSNELFGTEVKPDIDVIAISEQLENNYMLPVLCEGCAIVAVSKDEGGKVFVTTDEGDNGYVNHPLSVWESGELYKKYM
jgi:hypothetical protein